MAQNSAIGDSRSPHAMLHLLCTKITGLKEDALNPCFKMAMTTLSSNISTPMTCDELEVSEKIKKKLVRQHREKDAACFADLHRKLQGHTLLKNRWAVFYLLYRLSEDKTRQNQVGRGGGFKQGLSAHQMSTPYPTPRWNRTPAQSTVDATAVHTVSSAGSSGIGSIHSSAYRSQDPSPITQSFAPGSVPPAYMRNESHMTSGPGTAVKLSQALDKTRGTVSDMALAVRDQYSRGKTQSSRDVGRAPQRQPEKVSNDLAEYIIIQEIVYIFQGIEGKFVKFDVTKDGYRLDPKMKISRSARRMVAMLTECGWLYNKIRKYSDARSTERTLGLVGQSFCASIHQELNNYYKLLAVLESQLHQQEDEGVSLSSTSLTLRQLVVWTSDPLLRLKTLASLVDICQGKKGGAVASAVYSYLQHGDPSVRALIQHTLTLVAEPIFTTILRWIYDGELDDNYHEFFVASDPTVKDIRLWHDKYSLRKSMIPSFLTSDQARMILLTGKSINFLRQLCQDRTTIRSRDVVLKAETNQVESIFTQDAGLFNKMIDTVYKETSRHLLDVLYTKYQFMDHLKAMRRYLLLGQGDFIRHLMDLLQADLAKPAHTLFLHNLNGVLETAIRATNAQFDNPDILKRLDSILHDVSPEDTGWDVFSLHYHVAGPISTVFTPESMLIYLRVFNFLWRAKRVEYVLASVWRNQMYNARLLRSMPELADILHQCHMIASEMIHFVQQVQYYINFEVLECAWDELLNKVRDAKDLDYVVAAHQEFLDTINSRALLDKNSTYILTQLRAIFDLIIKFQQVQDNIYQSAEEELRQRRRYEDNIRLNTDQSKWGLTENDEKVERERREKFSVAISQLKILPNSYQDMVRQFLEMLAPLSDVSLRSLSFRLDFNENYRSKSPSLRLSLSGVRSFKAR